MKKDLGFLHMDQLPYDTLKFILILAKPFLNFRECQDSTGRSSQTSTFINRYRSSST